MDLGVLGFAVGGQEFVDEALGSQDALHLRFATGSLLLAFDGFPNAGQLFRETVRLLMPLGVFLFVSILERIVNRNQTAFWLA